MPTQSFSYLKKDTYYFDTACQSLRPKNVIEAELKYYTDCNSCGGRGNSDFVMRVDEVMYSTRKQILEFLGKSEMQYIVVFAPNTTYAINTLLTNLNWNLYDGLTTTSKEHNSVLLPCQSFAKRYNKTLTVFDRNQQNSLDYKAISELKKNVCIFNTTSNIDGSTIDDIETLSKVVKRENNLLFLDATQSLAHNEIDFFDLDFDCLFASNHKIYGPSGGFMVMKKSLLKDLDQYWVGGGTVQNVTKDSYELINIPTELSARLEFGLQDYGAIFGLNEALDWVEKFSIKNEYEKIDYEASAFQKISQKITKFGPSQEVFYYLESLSEVLFLNLKKLEKRGLIKVINQKASSIISFVPRNQSSYELTKKLNSKNIICRSGYMCCHYYIREVLKMPPLVRLSLGLHNTPADIVFLLKTLEKIL